MSLDRACVAAVGGLAAIRVLSATRHRGWVANVSQTLLMPTLAGGLVAGGGAGTREERWVVTALLCSTAGDTVPRFRRGERAFRVLVGCFAGAHVAYLAAFAPAAVQRLRHRPAAMIAPLAGYGFLYALIQRLCQDRARATGLGTAVAGYGILLGATGVLTAVRGGRIAVGGALFAVSDSLIALERFVPGWRPHILGRDVQDGLVMLTYVAAQTLIADGVAAAGQ